VKILTKFKAADSELTSRKSSRTKVPLKVNSAFSPAINTSNFKKNFYLKRNSKELVEKYGNIDFEKVNHASLLANTGGIELAINSNTGIAVEKTKGAGCLPPIKWGQESKETLENGPV